MKPNKRHEDRVKSMRAALIAVDRAMGRSIAQIAEDYRIGPNQVKQALDLATESGFIEHFRSMLYNRLGAKVMAVFEAQLDQGNYDCARDLAQGLGILQKESSATKMRDKLIDSLDAWREERAKRKMEQEVVDVEVIERPDRGPELPHQGEAAPDGAVRGDEPERPGHPD